MTDTVGTSGVALAVGGVPPGQPTKQIFCPVDPSNANYMTTYRVRTQAGSAQFNYNLWIPHDFASLLSAQLIGTPNASFGAAGAIDLESNYGAIGELSTTHNETDSLTGLSGVLDVFQGIDLSSVLTEIAAGDFCGIMVDHVSGIGTTMNYLGILMQYD